MTGLMLHMVKETRLMLKGAEVCQNYAHCRVNKGLAGSVFGLYGANPSQYDAIAVGICNSLKNNTRNQSAQNEIVQLGVHGGLLALCVYDGYYGVLYRIRIAACCMCDICRLCHIASITSL